jgi:hypothetical protein
MTNTKTLIVMMCMTSLAALAFAEGAPKAPPPLVAPADAKNHLGDLATVCGMVIDAEIKDPGIGGRGKPIFFNLDRPKSNPVFYFIAFGAKPGGFQEAKDLIAVYQGKRVCVTGKISPGTDAVPLIFTADRSQIKVQAEKK